MVQTEGITSINRHLNHKNLSSSQDPPSPDVGLVMGLLLSSPPFFLPACLLPPSHRHPSPLPQMAEPGQEAQGLGPDKVQGQCPPDLAHGQSPLPVQGHSSSGPLPGCHSTLSQHPHQAVEVLGPISSRSHYQGLQLAKRLESSDQGPSLWSSGSVESPVVLLQLLLIPSLQASCPLHYSCSFPSRGMPRDSSTYNFKLC